MGFIGKCYHFYYFYRENIFQFQITLDFELYLFFCSGCLCIVHKLFVLSDDSLYKVLHYGVIKRLMLYKKKICHVTGQVWKVHIPCIPAWQLAHIQPYYLYSWILFMYECSIFLLWVLVTWFYISVQSAERHWRQIQVKISWFTTWVIVAWLKQNFEK